MASSKVWPMTSGTGVLVLSFDETKFQPHLFFVESFQQLYEKTDELYKLLKEGRLDNVAPGEP